MPAIVLRMMDDCKFFFVKNTLIDAYWILLGSYLSSLVRKKQKKLTSNQTNSKLMCFFVLLLLLDFFKSKIGHFIAFVVQAFQYI